VIVGIPAEVKDNEYRVAATPEGVRELARAGHQVVVETGAGLGSDLPDDRFVAAGARIVSDADAVFAEAGLIVKVKEPQPEEYERFRRGQILFTFLHLAADERLTEFLLERDVAAVAYETVELPDHRLPHVGATYLERPHGGRGVLMGGAAGVAPARTVVLGAGMAGLNAAWIAAGLEAEVVVLDKNVDRLRYVDQIQRGRIQTVMSSALAIEELVGDADLVIGAVLIPGAKAPHLVTEQMVKEMRAGSVLVDISIDQGGCVETARMTTHSAPVYVEHDVVHYCVGNMPGAVPRTSTYALTNVTLPYVLEIASKGLEEAVWTDRALALGVNTLRGRVTNAGVAEAHGLPFAALDGLLS
jgi:alanine dehydrogenase